MVDTVILRLNREHFNIMSSAFDRFTPSASCILGKNPCFLGNGKILKCVLNPTSEDKRKGIYLPRVTLYRALRNGGYNIFLNIEFSAPKVLFGNNFDELVDDDFENLCFKLARDLSKMGILVHYEFIQNAEVAAIHFGKNLVFTDYITTAQIIADLGRSDVSTRKQADVRAYRNDGEAIHYYTNKQGLVIYDKIAEFKKGRVSEKGLFEQDRYCQMSLFDYNPPVRPFEVMRIEARYIGKRAIRNILEKTEITIDELTFCNLYSSNISQKILLYNFDFLDRGNLHFNEATANNAVDFANELRFRNPNATVSQIEKALVLFVFYQETGSRDIRKILGLNSSQWSRYKKSVSGLVFQRYKTNTFDKMKDKLLRFETVKLKDYRIKTEEDIV